MPPAVMAEPMATRSSLELMLESIRQRDENPRDVPPALPARPTSSGRRPSSRSSLPLHISGCGMEAAKGDAKLLGLFARMESHENGSSKKITGMDSFEHQTPQRDAGSNESPLHGVQDLLKHKEIQRGALSLKSFVRGEGDRHELEFLRKRWRAAVVVQSVFRGWLARKHFIIPKCSRHSQLNANGNFNFVKGMEEQPRAHRVLVEELQTRVLNTETVLKHKEKENITFQKELQQCQNKIKSMEEKLRKASGQEPVQSDVLVLEAAFRAKEDENAALKQQLHQHENRRSEYEAKLKSMVEAWHKQVASLQMRLTAASVGGDGRPEETNGRHPPGPNSAGNNNEDAVGKLAAEFESKRLKFESDVGCLVAADPVRPPAGDPDEELQKLKTQFASWKKAFKARLKEAKSAIEASESTRLRRRWWCTKK